MANAGQTVNVSGLRELGVAMQALRNDMARRVAAQAVAAGAGVVKKHAKARAPVAARAYVAQGSEMVGSKRKGRLEVDEVLVQPGNVPKQIAARKVRRTSLTAEYVVGVRGGKARGYASRIASLIERGTVKQSPRPFLGPALENNVQAVSDAIAARLRRRIQQVGQ